MKCGAKPSVVVFVSLQQSQLRTRMFCYHMFLPINLMCSLQVTAPSQLTAWAAAHCKGILNMCDVVTLAKLINTD